MLSVRAATDPSYARHHRLAVDAYALQHPDAYCRSAKSLAAHLTGVCAAIEQASRVAEINDVVQRWLSSNPPLQRPPPPIARGAFTILDLGDDPNDVHTWALSVWQAWVEQHALARSWIASALKKANRPSPASVTRQNANSGIK